MSEFLCSYCMLSSVFCVSLICLCVILIIKIGYFFFLLFFFFKQKTAYEMRISDWSSDVCSSDLPQRINASGNAHKRERGDFVHSISLSCRSRNQHDSRGASG